MSKKINEFKRARAAKIDEMKAITARAEKEKRFKSQEEAVKWNTLKSEIEEINVDLATEEQQERIDKGEISAYFSNQSSRESRELMGFDLSKAIREVSGRGLTGLEKEMQQEGEREYSSYGKSARGLVLPTKLMRSFAKATHSGHANEIVGKLDTITDQGILTQLGVTVYDNLTDQIKMTYGDGFTAQFYAEGAVAGEGDHNETSGKIEPRRIQAHKPFYNEYLAQSAVMPQMMQDMVSSIEAAAAREVIKKILALPALAGFDAAVDPGEALTWANVMKLKGALKSTQFIRPKFVAGGELYASLEATPKDAGSGRFIIDGGKISAYDAFDAQGIIEAIPDTAADADSDPTHALIFGDWSRAYVGYFGGIEILVDPYTKSDEGQTKLTWCRLADASVNPNAFKSIQNAAV